MRGRSRFYGNKKAFRRNATSQLEFKAPGWEDDTILDHKRWRERASEYYQ
jgi:hypothetical protein